MANFWDQDPIVESSKGGDEFWLNDPVVGGAKRDTGFTGALKASIEDIKGEGALTLGKVGLMDEQAAERYAAAQKAKREQIYQPTQKGWTEAPGEKMREMLGSSAAYAAIPLAAAGAGAILPVSAIGGIGAATLAGVGAGTAQYTGTNLARQIETGKKLADTNLLSAGSAAFGEALLDRLSFGAIPGVRRIFSAAGKELTEEAAQQIAKKGVMATAGELALAGTKAAGAEGATEAAQAFLERLQAGLNISNAEARDEYFQNFIGGAILGGTLGVPGRVFENMTSKAPALPGQEPTEPTAPPPKASEIYPTAEPVTMAGLEPMAPIEQPEVAPSPITPIEQPKTVVSEEVSTEPPQVAETVVEKPQDTFAFFDKGQLKQVQGSVIEKDGKQYIQYTNENGNIGKRQLTDNVSVNPTPDQLDLMSLYRERDALVNQKDNLLPWLKKYGIKPTEKADMGIDPASKKYPVGVFKSQGYALDELAMAALNDGILTEADLAGVDQVEKFREIIRDTLEGSGAPTIFNLNNSAKLDAIQNQIEAIEASNRESVTEEAPTEEVPTAPMVEQTVFQVNPDAEIQAEMDRKAAEAAAQKPAPTGVLDEDIPFERATPYADKFIAAERKLASTLRSSLDKMGLKNVAVNLEDRLQEIREGQPTDVNGYYFQKMINLSLAGDNIFRTMNHEALHAMKDLGFFTDAEWKLLEGKAKSTWMKKYDIAKDYGDKSMEIQLEEAIAKAFADKQTQEPKIKSIMEKAISLLKRIGNVLRGNGFTSAEDIFAKAAEGKLKGTKAPSSVAGSFERKANENEWVNRQEFEKYKNAPKTLMGYGKNAPLKGFDKENYKHHEFLEIKLPNGKTFYDSLRGLNRTHVLARAFLNWDADAIRTVSKEEAFKQDPQLVRSTEVSMRGKKAMEDKSIFPSASEMSDEQLREEIRKSNLSSFRAERTYSNAPPKAFTKLAPQQTAGEKIQTINSNVKKAWNDDNFWTSLRNSWIDPNSGLTQSLKKLPTFDSNGQLRADMVSHSQAQSINLIKNGMLTGMPTLNKDGTIIIDESENNLARSQTIADSIDSNPLVKASGLSGRGFIAEIARAMRGKELIEEDQNRHKLGDDQLKLAKDIIEQVKKARNENRPVGEIRRLLDRARTLRKQGYENKAANRELQVTPEQIAWAEKQLKDVPEVQQVLDIWKNVNDSLVSLWEQVGLLTKDQADNYRSKKSYVPLYKAREDLSDMPTGYGGTGLKTAKEIKRLKGADIDRNIWENVEKHYASMIASAYQNQTRKVGVNQLKTFDLARVTKADDPDVNLRYRDPSDSNADSQGIVHAVVENPNDLAAFQMMHYELGPIMKGFAAANSVLRAGALLNPMFWIKQLVRDPLHASLVTNSGIITPFHSAKGYIDVLRGDSREAGILSRAGVIGEMDSTMDLQDFLKHVGMEKKDPSFLSKALHKALKFHEASDAATRVAIFKDQEKQALAKGMSKEDAVNYAVFKARESINFAIHGNSPTINALRNMIPFLSATINSLDTVYRAASGYGLNAEEKKVAQTMFVKRAAMMSVLATAYAMLYQGDEDYKKLPDYVKDQNFLFPNPFGDGHTFIKLPIPFEVGFLFKTIPEASVRYMAGNSTGKEVLASYLQGVTNVIPGNGVPLPQAVKPIIETITNHSFFTHRPIESVGEQNLPVAMRGQRASEVAKQLSALGLDKIGLSPAKIDYLIQGYTAELGAFSMNMASSAVDLATGQERTAKNIEEMPFMKSFMTNPKASKAIADFYDLAHNAQETVNEFNDYKKFGESEKIKELMADEESRKLIAVAPALRGVQSQMTALRAQMKMIDKNQNIDPETRRERLNSLQKTYERLALQGETIAKAMKIER